VYMKVRKPCAALLAGLVLVLAATPSMAQHAGFRIGIAPIVGPPGAFSGFGQPMVGPFGIAPVAVFPQSTFGFPPTQAPVVVTRGGFVPGSPFVTQPFGGFLIQTPSVFVPGQTFATNPFIVTGQVFPNPFAGVGQVVPNPFIVPGQVFAPGQVVLPGSVFTQAPRTHLTPANSIPIPGVGTPRAQVLTQLGQPTVSIITSTGETLFFNGGITVFIQNGQVAVPR
jgi:hypothetical protein